MLSTAAYGVGQHLTGGDALQATGGARLGAMRYKVRIEGRTFEAEVGNVDARPIVLLAFAE